MPADRRNDATASSRMSRRVSIGRKPTPQASPDVRVAGLDGKALGLDGVSSSYTAVGPPTPRRSSSSTARGCHAACGTRSCQALSGGFRVIALDLPGHGALRDRPFDWDEAVDEIARVIDEAAGGRAILCGLSLGGYLAIDVAARYPAKVAGLVITGASAEPRGRLMPLGIRWLATLMDRTATPRLERVNRAWFRRRYPGPTANAILAGGFGFPAGTTALRELVGRDAPGHVRDLSGTFTHPQRPARRPVPARSGRLPEGRPRLARGGHPPRVAPGQPRSTVGLQRGARQVRGGGGLRRTAGRPPVTHPIRRGNAPVRADPCRR